jgi:CBS domain containing-hemolysin-like protein
VLKRLGRLPNVGDTVTLDGFELEVREVRRHSIGEVAIRVVEDRADLADADDGSAADP